MLDLDMMGRGVQLIIIIISQVWNWFQNRRYAIRAKTSKAPGKLAVSPVVQIESTPVRNVPQTVVVPAPAPVGIKKNCYVILVFKYFHFLMLFFLFYYMFITSLSSQIYSSSRMAFVKSSVQAWITISKLFLAGTGKKMYAEAWQL